MTRTHVQSGFSARALAWVAGGALGASVLASPALADFTYPNFNTVPNLAFNGVAVQSAPTLSVTPPVGASAGSVWHTTQQNVGLGFVSNFTFRISDLLGVGADGFAFVIQNSAAGTTALGASGGGLGYATNLVFPAQQGIANSLAIEFDMYNNNSNWPDFASDNHISVQTMGTGVNSPSQTASLGGMIPTTNMSNGAAHNVRVIYVPGLLSVFLDNLVTPALSVPINLGATLNLNGQQAYVGFTAATGSPAHAQRHNIQSWDFSGTIPTPGTASLLALGGLVATRRRRAH